jgi:Pentapeptide repeats (8 copies)
MTNTATKKSQQVRFEEVTPTHEIVAYFNAQLPDLLAGTGLPIFPGYDDLDYIQFAYITLPSGNTVVLGQYENAPENGVDLYVELDRKHNSNAIAANIPTLVVETLRYLAIPREIAIWFHPDYEPEIERLYSKDGEFESIPKIPTAESTLSTEYEPIDCFYHALEIYTRPKFPEHWAMLQHNLGLAYFDRIKDERWRNLQKSIEYYHRSLEVFTHEIFPRKWQINQEDLSQSLEAWEVEKQNLIRDILNRPRANRSLKYADLSSANFHGANLSRANLHDAKLSGANLMDADLSSANLNGTNLRGAKLNSTDLSNANLSSANLHGANLSSANLRGANLSGAILSYTTNVYKAQFRDNQGISESMREDLRAQGAIFEDFPGDRSESRIPVPR